MRNIYYVYISAQNNTHEILYNGKVERHEGINVLAHINISQPALVFINLMGYVKQRYPGGTSAGDNYKKFNQQETLEYTYGNVVFRNIACFTNGQSEELLMDLYPGMDITKAMEQFVLSLNKDPQKVKYTLGYHVKKMFYEDIKDELWQFKKEHKSYYFDLETYNDMMVANKSGALSDIHIYAESVLAFDKRSAYASVMVNDDKFPIGQTRRINCKNGNMAYSYVKQYLRKGEWCKVVVDHIVPGFELYYDEEVQKTGLEYYNFIDLQEENKLKEFFENITECRFYKTTETGRLPLVLRQRIIECFDNKESMTGVAKFFEKTKINIIYGKGIQKYGFTTKQELQRHYKARGENYLNPEQSLHCQAALNYEIHKAIRYNVAVYWDTDGIKVKDTKEAREYFYEQNNIIQHKNAEAGFESEIGTWKLEEECEEFISFGAKRYIIKTDKKYESTWAGIRKCDQEVMLENLGKDKIHNAMKIPVVEIRKVILLDFSRIIYKTCYKFIRFQPSQ